MNCDDAFDALTDPERSDAAELDRHLASCPRCRDLKQVLEPALSLLGREAPAEENLAAEDRGNDSSAVRFKKPFLTIEAVGMAEATSARLTTSRGAGGVRPLRPLSGSRALYRTAASAAIILVGGLAFFCVGLRDWKSDSLIQPSIVPSRLTPARACTRNDYPRMSKPGRDAQSVILTCVACHLRDRQVVKPLSTLLIWPQRGKVNPGVSLCGDGPRWIALPSRRLPENGRAFEPLRQS